MRIAFALLLIAGNVATAQSAPYPVMFDLSRVPDRPQLVSRAGGDTPAPDTNDAHTYYAAGMASMAADPEGAAAAFYWASRLDPSWAEPYFARWYTLIKVARARKWQKTLREIIGPALPDSVLRQIDSVGHLASLRDPFFDDGLRATEFSNAMRTSIDVRRARVQQENIVRDEQGQRLLRLPSNTKFPHTWFLAYEEHHFDSASADLAMLIKKYPDAFYLYVYRSKALYRLGQFDSATAVLRTAISRVDRRDTTDIVRFYLSTEMLQYAIGMAESQGKHDSAAQAAFQTAVTQNLGFYMAHLHLASAALARRDSATALREARIAAEIRPEDPLVQLLLGYTLFAARHPAEAIEHFRAATVSDPYFATPYYYIGQASELTHDTVGALTGYRDFLAHASRSDNLRKSAEEAIAVLGGSAQ